MRRREFVTTASATIATASIAGCSGILGGGGGGGSSGPQGAVEAYVDAVNDNDAEAMQDLAHPDGSGQGQISDSDLEALSMSIESIETIEQSDGQATVEAEIETTFSMNGEEMSSTQTSEFDVRKHEGEWLIYDSTTVSSEES